MAKDFITGRKTTFGKKRSQCFKPNEPFMETKFAKSSHLG